MQNEWVSIILPTYNRGNVLKKALESVLTQSYPYFEVILVDDGSTDCTKELVETYQDNRICYYYAGLNQGAAAARNYGLQRARYNYIAFEDSDDIWKQDKLKKQIEAIKKTPERVGFVYHKIAYDMGNNLQAILPSEEISIEKKSGDILAQMLYDNLVPCPSLLIKKKCIEEIGMFDIELKALEDYDFALRLAKRYQAIFLDEILLDATYSIDGVSANAVNYLLASCKLLQKYKKEYLATSTFDHRIEIILRDSKMLGMQEQFVRLLERMLQTND